VQGIASLPDCPTLRMDLKTPELVSLPLLNQDELRNSKDGSGGGG